MKIPTRFFEEDGDEYCYKRKNFSGIPPTWRKQNSYWSDTR